MLKKFKSQSVVWHLMVSALLIALVPVSFLSVHLYNAAWDDSWREIREKHQLIAENLALPITTYINDHRNMLALITESFTHIDIQNKSHVEQFLSNSIRKVEGFKSLTLLGNKGNILGLAHLTHKNIPLTTLLKKSYAEEQTYLDTVKKGGWHLSGVKRSLLSGEPALILSYPVLSKQKKILGVILSELDIALIDKLQSNVKFGVLGHSVVLDQNGRLIAHPNASWVKNMRDLSRLSIVKLMMAGKTGVTTFYSPFLKENMVAGYTSVPEYGWGIMVPQPEGEVSAQVQRLMYSNIIWGLAGVVLAILLAIVLSRWINNPINRLAAAGNALLENDLIGDMGESHENDPYEVKQLNDVVRSLVFGLQRSQQELQELNDNLYVRIEEATQRLRESNLKLEKTTNSDYLTSLANRRYFEEILNKSLGRRSSDTGDLCIMLLDIDNFKAINDTYGHGGGDEALIEIARLMVTTLRTADLVARYAGDEFVVMMYCDKEIALKRAEQIRAAVEELTILCEQQQIKTTVSIGVYCHQDNSELDISKIMLQVDEAMYKAKDAGRNKVVAID